MDTQKTLDKQTAKLIERMVENLPEISGDTMQDWIESPKELQKKLGFLSSPPCEEKPELTVWKTIQLSTHKSVDDIRSDLKENGFSVTDWADDILGKVVISQERTAVNLVGVSVAELGFKEGATRTKVYDRAQELGLELCPAEIGPQLRLQYKDQPNGEWLLIGMEPITVSAGYSVIFDVVRVNDGSRLYVACSRPDSFWCSDSCWVFLKRYE